VIGSAVVPTMIANSFFMPKHLLAGGTRRVSFAVVIDAGGLGKLSMWPQHRPSLT